MSVDPDLLDRLGRFLRDYCHEEILSLVESYPSESRSLPVDWMDLYRFDTDVAEDALDSPDQLRDHLNEALYQYDLPADVDLSRAAVRVYNIDDGATYGVGEYRSEQRNQYIAVTGQISKASKVKPHLVEGVFECTRCGTTTTIPQADMEGITEPHECTGCERQGSFTVNHDQSTFENRQAVRIREPPEAATGGGAGTVDAYFIDDQTAVLEPGDRTTVSGELRLRQTDDDSADFEYYLEGEAIEIEETDYEEIDTQAHRDRINALAAGEEDDPYKLLIDSIGPKIAGHDQIKLALALQLFGGNKASYPGGTTGRGDSHILLVGDPGTAKSSLLRYIESVAPRSVYASGKGASAAGLTAAAVADDFGDTKWSLEAGALVESNKGVACIDEIDKVNEEVVSSLHDALESQRVTVNKAGINATLPAETSLLAAGNPKHGRFDQYDSIADQIDLGPTLLSRFDLIFTLSDQPDEEHDREITKQIVEGRQTAIRNTRGDHLSDDDLATIEPAVEPEILRAWVALARQTINPVIEDDDVQESLEESFISIRLANGEDNDAPVPLTFRKLDGLQRLAEASARIRLSDTVEQQDIDRARTIVGDCLRDVGIDNDSDQYDADIVETGQSTTQRKRVQTVESLIGELQDQYDSGVPTDELLEAAVDSGFSHEETKHTIQKLKDKGDVYEPNTDRLRVV